MKITVIGEELKNNDALEQFSIDVLTGLCSKPKMLPAKYFYDDIGSKIFQKITSHNDYYPTRSEFNILKDICSKLPDVLTDEEIDIIELGVGDGHKSKLVIDGFKDAGTKVNFYPIDISREAMNLLKENIKEDDQLSIEAIVSEYFQGLKYVREHSKNKKLILFLGSNVGNFNIVQVQGFLRRLWLTLGKEDHVLIGFDLKKDINKLLSAYNDSDGLTRDFNLNLLTRINRELGGNFDLDKFQHYGTYNPSLGAMESYLVSLEDQDIKIDELERSFHFKPYEAIHLEYSFKYIESDIDFLSEKTGFEVIKNYYDENKYFTDSLWKVLK